jgi:hypothetical protein
MTPLEFHSHVVALTQRLVDGLKQVETGRLLTTRRIGPISFWDIFCSDISEILYQLASEHSEVSTLSELETALQRGRSNGVDAGDSLPAILWQNTYNSDVVLGILHKRFPTACQKFERVFQQGRRKKGCCSGQIDVAVCGYTRTGPLLGLADCIQSILQNYSCTILAHEDLFWRRTRGLRSASLPFEYADHYVREEHEKNISSVLSDFKNLPSGEFPRLTAIVRRKLLLGSYFKTIAIAAEATRAFLLRRKPRLVIVPDLRLPLAHASSILAAEIGAEVVSCPALNNQTGMHMPLEETKAWILSPFSALATELARNQPGERRFVLELCSGKIPEEKGKRLPKVPAKILFASQATRLNRFLIPAVQRAIARVPGTELTIRPHPIEHSRILQWLVGSTKVEKRGSSSEALAECDVLICHSSTIAIDAALSACPLILFSPNVPQLPFLLNAGCALWARSEDELSRTVARLLTETAARDRMLLAQNKFRKGALNDAEAAHSTAEILDTLLRGAPLETLQEGHR